MTTIWVLVLICSGSFWCSQGEIWQADQVYRNVDDCYAEGKIRAKKLGARSILCIEGRDVK